MRGEVGLADELLAAVLARVGLLARVRHLVLSEVRGRVECLLAEVAVQVVRVASHVLLQLLLADEGLRADVAQVGVVFQVLVKMCG